MNSINALQLVTEPIPQGLENPEYLLAAVGVIAIGAFHEWQERTLARRATPDLPGFADPFLRETVPEQANRPARLRGSLTALSTGFLALTLVQAAQPYTTENEVIGSVNVVVDGSYPADAADMTEGEESGVTRLSAAISGAMQAAKETDAPFNLILSGSEAKLVYSGRAGDKNVSSIPQKATEALTPTFRVGQSMPESVRAAASQGEGAKNVIVIGSSLGSQIEQVAIAEVNRNLEASKAGQVFGIAIGAGEGTYRAGGEDHIAGVDNLGFEATLTSENVRSATSTKEIAEHIIEIADKTAEKSDNQPTNFFVETAYKLAMLASGTWFVSQGMNRLRLSRRIHSKKEQ